MQTQNQPIQRDSNKIYFLIAVIIALLGTNTYLFLKDKKNTKNIVSISDEKTRMEIEIDKIEAELDNATSITIQLSEEKRIEQENARKQIDQLRAALSEGQLSQAQLKNAQEEIKKLKIIVSKYSAEIEELKRQNANLSFERDELKTTVDSINYKASNLEKKNEELISKVRIAEYLKIANVSIASLAIKNNGKENLVNRASITDKFKINFNIVNNTLSPKGMYNIYLRIIDPSGNLIIPNNNGTFSLEDEELQYTYKTAIEFLNDGKSYIIDWVNKGNFQKGNYTILLYSDGYSIGKGSINLK
jgi:multidrug efflux pump subunit AcrA (membrane-fusion protein)